MVLNSVSSLGSDDLDMMTQKEPITEKCKLFEVATSQDLNPESYNYRPKEIVTSPGMARVPVLNSITGMID